MTCGACIGHECLCGRADERDAVADIKALVARRAALTDEIRRIDEQLNAFRAALGEPAAHRRASVFGQTPQRVLAVLRAAGGPMSAVRIADAADAERGAVYVALQRLRKKGLVHSVRHGEWAIGGGS
jgi:DNA-binding transcriptional ArsR family regulator